MTGGGADEFQQAVASTDMATPAARVAAQVVELVRAAIDPATETTPEAAVLGIRPESLAALFHPQIVGTTLAEPLTTGLGASPGVSSGRLVLTTAAALDADDDGHAVILARPTTSPEDVLAMRTTAGLITSSGGLASHAAVVARGWGVPAVVGAATLEFVNGGVRVGDRFVAEGQDVTIDGSTGEVLIGAVQTIPPPVPTELDQLLAWADHFRGELAVRANADTAGEAREARRLGAQGIGLCRTEHMFLADDRLPLMRAYILAEDPAEQQSLLTELEHAQESDFVEVLEAMDALPITVRLLDPPLHEFLPDLDGLLPQHAGGPPSNSTQSQLSAVRRLQESNPMLGTRGVRLGVIRPGLYQMQVRALCRAASTLIAQGRHPRLEIMIPFVSGSREFDTARAWVRDVLAEFCGSGSDPAGIRVGAMIETPRMALIAGRVAHNSDFFSFGTNDLTQLTFGLSRDDVEAELIPAYLASDLLSANPFERLDTVGVGRLIEMACNDARRSGADIALGMCGEHAAHPSSADFVVSAGLDYVSCSPYRVPIARLALAQARLTADKAGADAGSTSSPGAAPRLEDASTSSLQVGEDDLMAVLHAVTVKGFATAEAVLKISGTSADVTAASLEELRDRGHVRFLAPRGLWRPTDLGVRERTARLRELCGPNDEELRRHYADFLEVNVQVKQLCTNWQTRTSEPSADAIATSYQPLLEDFAALDDQAHAVIAQLRSHVPRLAGYSRRLSAAATRVLAGESAMLTGVMCDSYHDIWMELHEDLVQLLAIDRTAEGSY